MTIAWVSSENLSSNVCGHNVLSTKHDVAVLGKAGGVMS